MLGPKAVFPVFFALWIAVALGGFLFFTRAKDVARKRRLFPRLTIAAGALFALAIFAMAPWPIALFFAPFVAVIVWLNIRMTRFCEACGKIVINQQWWARMNYCPHCGAKLPE